jgi:hypothetical protein
VGIGSHKGSSGYVVFNPERDPGGGEMRKILLAIITILVLSGCMYYRVVAESGSTINVTNSGNKTVSIPIDATVPVSALGL